VYYTLPMSTPFCRRWVGACFITLWVCLSGVFSTPAYALGASASFTVSARIQPAIYIVTNQRLVIQQILSNSARHVPPTMWRNAITGQPLPFNRGVYRQYEQLTASRYPIKQGVVYNRQTALSIASTSPDALMHLSSLVSRINEIQLSL